MKHIFSNHVDDSDCVNYRKGGKRLARGRTSKHKQYNGLKKTINYLQTAAQSTKDWSTRTPQKWRWTRVFRKGQQLMLPQMLSQPCIKDILIETTSLWNVKWYIIYSICRWCCWNVITCKCKCYSCRAIDLVLLFSIRFMYSIINLHKGSS
jgi:hypothetical protein